MNEKKIILTVGISLAIISILARLSVVGWIFLIGLTTIFIFGIFHLIFLFQIFKHFDKLRIHHKRIAWFGILIFPLIFIFQFDFGDSAGNFYIYEYLTGENSSNFENYAFYIAILAAIIYLGNFVNWILKTKKL